ncbi:hypothetical protein Sjap_012133 [Stephania japonica]|uniref:Uncharacterized protein n=1 Tax=Stephania japonica TaxID=461633 RepID=A0AAP0P016_9MAGN
MKCGALARSTHPLSFPKLTCSLVKKEEPRYIHPLITQGTHHFSQDRYQPCMHSLLGLVRIMDEGVDQIEGGDRRNFAPWNSGICACCDDPQSCCIGLVCPCYVYGRNAEFLGSGSFVGSCLAHCILWGGSTALCCLVTDGILLGLSGCVVAGYAYRYRRALRSKYNLPEEPCGDFTTHVCCHLCAVCQEYREIRDRSGKSVSSVAIPEEISAPPMQTMQSPSEE